MCSNALRLPDDYLRFHQNRLTTSEYGENNIHLSRLRWLQPEAIASWEYYIERRGQFIPFADSPNGDTYVWYSVCGTNDQPLGVVYSPRDEDWAEWISVNFTDFLVWAILDEARESWLCRQLDIEPTEVGLLLAKYVDRCQCLLPFGICGRLKKILDSPPNIDANGCVSLISTKEFSLLIDELIPFEKRGDGFSQWD